MPATYQNTFNPRTTVGQGLSNAMLAMFNSQPTPADTSAYLKSQAEMEKLRREAEGQELENQMLQRQYEQSDPGRIPQIVAQHTGIPVPQVNQELQFLSKGVPYAQGTPDPNQSASIGNVAAAFNSLPFMTGDTNYQQFMTGVNQGMDTRRTGMGATGQMDISELARLNAAQKGSPMVDVQEGYAFDPYGEAGQVESGRLSIADALIGERNAKAKYYNELDRGGSGSNNLDVASADIDQMRVSLFSILQKDGLVTFDKQGNYLPDESPVDPGSLNNIMERAIAYFMSPNSPAQGNHAAAIGHAYNEAQQKGVFTPETPNRTLNPATWFDSPTPAQFTVPGVTGGNMQGGIAGGMNIDPGIANDLTAQPNVVDELPPSNTLPEGTIIRDPATGHVLFTVKNGQYVSPGM